MAPVQKRALYSLVIGVILAIALVLVFVIRGDLDTFHEDQGFRLIVAALWVGVPLVSLITMKLTLRKPEQVDERDKLIMERSPKVQFWAVLFSIVAWVIVLTEVFWNQGKVPVIYLTLIMISTLVISTIAQSAGILIGYWRGSSNG